MFQKFLTLDPLGKFFSDQFSDKGILYKCDIDIDMNQFSDLKFNELDVLLLLKDTNPNKAAGPVRIHGMVLKN